MTNSIWKFELETTDKQIILMPKDAKILSLQTQNENPCIWVLVDSKAELEEREFEIFGTGNPIHWAKHIRNYVGTYQLKQGSLVFHVFELLK